MYRIDVIVGGDYNQGAFRFPMQILCVMKSGKMLSVQVVLLTFYAKIIIVIYPRTVFFYIELVILLQYLRKKSVF